MHEMKVLTKILKTYNFTKRLVTHNSPNIYQTTSLNEPVLFKSIQNKGLIILNRPEALNALTPTMTKNLYLQLKEWEGKKLMVIIKSVDGKVFCAGGDIKHVAKAVLEGKKPDISLFQIGNELIYLTACYKMPYIALLNGIVMGGGVGITIHGRYRIVTEKTIFAMPETAIGFFPDVSSSYFLSRLPARIGVYLSLTGCPLQGSDIVKSSIATHYCESDKLEELENTILCCNDKEDIPQILNKFHKKNSKPFILGPVLSKINKCFSAPTVEGIIKALEEDRSHWAQNTIATLLKMSPTSLKVTYKAINLGSKMSLKECLKMEYIACLRFLERKDFYEGIRAKLIDKDFKPLWTPKTLSEVTDSDVDSYFTKSAKCNTQI